MATVLAELGLDDVCDGVVAGSLRGGSGELLESRSPIDGRLLGSVRQASAEEYEKVVQISQESFRSWVTRVCGSPSRRSPDSELLIRWQSITYLDWETEVKHRELEGGIPFLSEIAGTLLRITR